MPEGTGPLRHLHRQSSDEGRELATRVGFGEGRLSARRPLAPIGGNAGTCPVADLPAGTGATGRKHGIPDLPECDVQG